MYHSRSRLPTFMYPRRQTKEKNCDLVITNQMWKTTTFFSILLYIPTMFGRTDHWLWFGGDVEQIFCTTATKIRLEFNALLSQKIVKTQTRCVQLHEKNRTKNIRRLADEEVFVKWGVEIYCKKLRYAKQWL